MKKILDNSAVSSMGKEITSFKMLEFLKGQYEVVLADAVFRECKALRNEDLYDSICDLPLATSKNDMFNDLVKAIRRIDYRLGPGETETIAASIILSDQGVYNYVVIDESLARKIVVSLHTNPLIKTIMGKDIQPINVTGTVGIIKHLRDKGLISDDDCKKMAYDLEFSNFRVSDDILNLIK